MPDYTSRLEGVLTSVALKAPCRVATTANITLSGLQTIDGVTVVADDRVLVKDQTDASENGIYNVSASDWVRASDFDGSRDVVGGTQITVIQGTANAGTYWRTTGYGAVEIETDDVAFESASGNSASLVEFTETGTGEEGIDLLALMRTDWINVFTYIPESLRAGIVAGTNTTSLTAYIQAALDASKSQGRSVFFPKGIYRSGSLTWNVTAYLSHASIFGVGPRIIGSGMSSTIFEMSATNAWLFDVTTDTSTKFALGGLFTGFTIKAVSGPPAGSAGIRLHKCFNFTISRFHITGMGGDGITVRCDVGDADSSGDILIQQGRIENCGGWGINAAAISGANEISYITLDQVYVQSCGTVANTTITGITAANPPVVTAVAHGRSNGDTIMIFDVVGMVQVNCRRFTVANKTDDTFELSGVTGSGYTAYSSGGTVCNYSGGMVWKGQMLKTDQVAWTINKNVALFIPGEAGVALDVDLRSSTFENNLTRHLAVGGVNGFKGRGVNFRNNDANPAATGAQFNGSLFSLQKLLIDGVNVRVTSGNNPYTLFKFTAPAATFMRGARIRNLIFENFGYTGQTAFDGFFFDAVPIQCALSTTTSAVSLAPRFYLSGDKMPLRQAYGGSSLATFTTGPWVEASIPTTGVSITNAGLANDTIYNVFLYDNANVLTLELATTATAVVIDTASGYQVKDGAPHKLFLGRVKTALGSTDFLTGDDANWLNPRFVAGQWQWADTNGDAMMKPSTGIYSELPASDSDGSVIGLQS